MLNAHSKNFEPKENTYVRLKEGMLGRDKNLSSLEQLFYLKNVFSAQLNQSKPVKKSSEDLAYELGIVALDLGTLRSKILRIEKSLEKKGFLQVMRSKSKQGHYCKNLILPLIADDLNSNNQFIPIRYGIIKQLFSNPDLSANFKLLILMIYAIAYKNYRITGKLSFSATTSELMQNSGLSRTTLFSFLKAIDEQKSVITRDKQYIDSEDNNRRDKYVHKFIIDESLIPNSFKQTHQILNEDKTLLVDQYTKDKVIILPVQPKSVSSKIETSKTIAKEDDKKENSAAYPSKIVDTPNKNTVVNSRTLNDYYPFTKEEVDTLNSKANREFSNNFVNQLLLKLYSKYPEKRFKDKFTFLSYMVQILENEKDQAPLVNHETFRFNCNIGKEEKNILEYERYLNHIEDSIDTSKEMCVKKKIAGRFSTEVAYKILTKVQFKKNQDNSFITALIPNHLAFSERQIATLSDQLEAVYGINRYYVQDIDEKIPIPKSQTSNIKPTQKSIGIAELSKKLDTTEKNISWQEIRKGLRQELGEHTDQAWFSKAVAAEDEEQKTLTLTMPTKFMSDWIKNNYSHVIRRLSDSVGMNRVEYGYE